MKQIQICKNLYVICIVVLKQTDLLKDQITRIFILFRRNRFVHFSKLYKLHNITMYIKKQNKNKT